MSVGKKLLNLGKGGGGAVYLAHQSDRIVWILL